MSAKCDKCGKCFKDNSVRNHHVRTVHSEERLHHCSQCPQSFKVKGSLTRHLRTQHGNKSLNCDHCGKAFSDNADLEKHVRLHTDERPYECEQCASTFKTLEDARRHLRNIHTNERPHPCSQCPSAFKTKQELKVHVAVHTNERPFKCHQCKTSFKRQEYLKNHIRRIHTDERPFQCDQCPSSFKTKRELKGHVGGVHTDERPLQSEQCSSSSNRQGHLTKHVIVRTVEKAFKCELCPISFKTAGELTTHVGGVHTDERPHQCDQCPRAFKTKHELKQHVEVHTVERAFKCEQCPSSFKSKRHLNIHIRGVHTVERAFKCEQCPSTFKTPGGARKHLRNIHTEKTFNCSQCTSSFKTKQDLKGHVGGVHTVERAFKCEHCPSSFKSKRHLNIHIREVHTVERAFKCDQCPSTFKRKSELRKHMECVHSLTLCGKKFELCDSKCTYCGQGFFKRQQYLKRHQKTCSQRNDWKCFNCEDLFVGKKLFMQHVRKFCPKRKLNFQCSFCKSTEGYDPENEIQVLEHVMTCKPPTTVQKYRCHICDHKFPPQTLSLHIQDELLNSRLFEDIPRTFECTSCQISFPTADLLKLHTKIEHPAQFSITSNWNNGDDDLDALQMTPENKDLLIAERKRIRELGMQEFAFKDILPSNQCYVCRRPWIGRILMKDHVRVCQLKFGVKKMETVQQQPLPYAKKSSNKKQGKSTKMNARTLQNVHDIIVKSSKTKNRLLDDGYWDDLEERYKLQPGLLINNISTILKNEPELLKYVREILGDVEIIPPPPKKPKIIHEVDLTKEATVEARPDPAPQVDDSYATVYFRRQNLRRNPKPWVNKYAPPVYPPKPTDYEDLSLWEFQDKLPEHKCYFCRRPFFSRYMMRDHERVCANQHALRNEHIDEGEATNELATPTMKKKMMYYLELALGNRYKQESVGMEQYWKKLEKFLNVPSDIIKKWHTGFSSKHPDNKELYDNLLAAIAARQEKARQEKENKTEKSTGPRLVLVKH